MRNYNGVLERGKRVHKIFEPWGYPIRLCSWTIADYVPEVKEPVNCASCLKKLNGEHGNCVAVEGLTDEKGYVLPEFRQELPRIE